MKKLLNIIFNVFLVASLMVLNSCEEQDFTLSEKVVSFSGSEASAAENTQSIGVPVNAAATSGSGTTITFEFVTDGISNPAIEGTDFTVRGGGNTLTFANSWGNDTIWLDLIDNAVNDKNKSVIINIVEASNGYKLSAQNSFTVTIIDDEHPLAKWLGTYSVAAASYGQPGNWDEAWTVTTSADPSNDNNIIMTGIAGSSNPITAVLDVDAGTITIPIGQNLGMAYEVDWPVDITIQKATADFVLLDEPVSGTINENGNMLLDFWAHYAPSEADFWDVFNTTWTKQ